MPVNLARRGAELGGLRQAGKPLRRRWWCIDAEWQGARLVQQRHDAGQVRIRDGIQAQRLRGLHVSGEGGLGLRDCRLVRLPRLHQCTGATQCDDQRKRRRSGADQDVAADRRRITRHQGRFAEHHLLQQAGQEIATSLLRPQRGRPRRIDAEAPRHHAGQSIDRRPLLRAGGQVHAAQQRRRVEARSAERFGEELGQWSGQAGNLGGEAGDQRASIRASLCLEPVKQTLVQSLDQQLEFRAEQRGGAGFGLGQRERRAPDLAASLAVEIVEEFGEPRDQVRLGEQRVDRHTHAQFVVEFLHPATDRTSMGQALGWRCSRNVRQSDRDQHAVQRLTSARALEQAEEGLPSRLVHRGRRALSSISTSS